jgi:hypothetical protein
MPETAPTIRPTGVYSTADVCALLDVSPATLNEARRSGALRAVRKGRRRIYLGEWLLEWLRTDPEGAARCVTR